MLSIRGKIILFSTILTGAMLCVFATALYINTKHNDIVKLDTELEQYASGFQRVLSSDLISNDFPDTSDINELNAEGPDDVQYRLEDKGGNLVIGTLSAFDAHKQNGFFDLSTGGIHYRALRIELETLNESEYHLIAAGPMNGIYASLRNLIYVFAILIPLLLIISGLALWGIIKMAFHPLKNIIQTAQSISANNLDCQIGIPKSQDEIQLLAKVFNEMIARLGTAFKSQKQFVADASHEIRTPLAIIQSELEFTHRYKLEPPVSESVAISLTEVERLASLAEGLLTLSRFDSGQIAMNIKQIDLGNFLREMVRLLENLAIRKSIKLDFVIHAPATILGDFELLKKAVLNLLDNAIKYSNHGAIVKIISDINPKQNQAVITIEDNGPGICEKDLANIFKRFYRAESTRSAVEGSGLGLSIAEHIVNLHKGEITVNSEPSRGTCFRINLPLA